MNREIRPQTPSDIDLLSQMNNQSNNKLVTSIVRPPTPKDLLITS